MPTSSRGQITTLILTDVTSLNFTGPTLAREEALVSTGELEYVTEKAFPVGRLAYSAAEFAPPDKEKGQLAQEVGVGQLGYNLLVPRLTSRARIFRFLQIISQHPSESLAPSQTARKLTASTKEPVFGFAFQLHEALESTLATMANLLTEQWLIPSPPSRGQKHRHLPSALAIRWGQASNWSAFSHPAGKVDEPLGDLVAEKLFPALVNARAGGRKFLFETLRRFSEPRAIVDVAFREYDRTSREGFLLHAVSLLEAFGNRAWPVLRQISRLKRPECELFIGLIARCPGISEEERIEALLNLSNNPNSAVRLGLIERSADFSPSKAKLLLGRLAADTDNEVKEEAVSRLALLDD